MEGGQDAVLGAISRLRKVCSDAKVDATVALAKQILEVEPSIVLFSYFTQVAKSLHQNLAESGWKGELLTGDTPPKDRQGMVDNFQVR